MSATPAPEHLDAMFDASARIRGERSELRVRLHAGEFTLEELLADPPACLDRLPLFRVMGWLRHCGPDHLRIVGAKAVRDNVNLFVSVGQASASTRAWAAAHAPRKRTSS